MLERFNMVTFVMSVFHEGNEYHPQVFLQNVFINYKLWNTVELICLGIRCY